VRLPSVWSKEDANEAMRQLLQATLEKESQVAARDSEVHAVAVRYEAPIASLNGRIALHEKHLHEYYEAHKQEIESAGKKRLQLGLGVIGMRSASNPALIPLDEKWTWEKIAKKLKSSFKSRFFHAPKPPGIDKVKVKKELTAAELEKCGLKLDDSESFYVEPNRLSSATSKMILPKAA